MLPILIIIIPLISSSVVMVGKKAETAKTASVCSLGAAFALSLFLLALTCGGSQISFSIGVAPWNLAVSAGALESLMSCLFTGVGLVSIWSSVFTIERDVGGGRVTLFYLLITGLISLLCSVVFFESLINVFIFIELSSFAAAGIVIVRDRSENIRAGLKYLSLSILGSGLVLMGIVVFYTVTGALDYTGIGLGVAGGYAQSEFSVVIALVFVTLGVSLKSALFPFHVWLPDAHAIAPSSSSSVLSSLVLKAFIIFYIKVIYRCVGVAFIGGTMIRTLLLAVEILGGASVVLGSLMAVLQTDLKRMIAYSTVSQIGYIFMCVGLGSREGLFAAVFHIFAHAITKSGLFLASGSIIEQTESRRIDRMHGIGVRMPVTMGIFAVGALSMIEIPLFIGFNSKWNISVAVMATGDYWVLGVLAVSTLLNALCYMPVVVNAFFGADADRIRAEKRAGSNVLLERPIKELLPLLLLAALVIGTAVFSRPFVEVIEAGISELWM